MLFNTFNFGIFFLIIFFVYWFPLKKSRIAQNIFLLLASYFFYACWDWRFLGLLIFSTILDYYSGIKISESHSKEIKKRWLITSVTINLGFLAFFKYFNFFIESFSTLLSSNGVQDNLWTLKIILPVGISFYTFHGLSYVYDIYYNRIKPERNVVDYSLFVSFFPLLVAGPIERATHLLPQILKERIYSRDESVRGLRQILWGLFKKVAIADNCAYFVNTIFENHHQYNASMHIIGAIFFAFQIYGDFSGYSDIALGTARLLGFKLLKNFSYPYFSRDIAEFWRRWHISLSSWFKDYVYIPLGGSKGNLGMQIRNTFVIFILSGFWHGANWTFIMWGFLNALYFMPYLIFKSNRNNIEIVANENSLPNLKEFIGMIFTFTLVTFAWIFFRSQTISDALLYISDIFTSDLGKVNMNLTSVIILISFLIMVEWIGRRSDFAIEKMMLNQSTWLRWSFYYIIIFLMIFNIRESQGFIYFQF